MSLGINVINVGKITSADLASMDIETAIMACQSSRANILEGELKSQILTIQAKNDQVTKLNQTKNALNKVLSKFDSDAKPEAVASKQTAIGSPYTAGTAAYEANQAIKAAGVNPFGRTQAELDKSGHVGDLSTKADLTAAIDAMKSQIDSLTNSQQMDMLRLQSLSAKRNEAFEVMTNLMKKFQGPRDSIISNMR
ncbi:MAG: hypothetical protein ABIR26_13725 [Ramlibacter sp.]